MMRGRETRGEVGERRASEGPASVCAAEEETRSSRRAPSTCLVLPLVCALCACVRCDTRGSIAEEALAHACTIGAVGMSERCVKT